MVWELANFEIIPGHEDSFGAAYRQVSEVLTSTPGCRGARLTRGVESPSRFVLKVEWDSVDAHERNFRATDRFTRWRAALSPHFASAPSVEHFDPLH